MKRGLPLALLCLLAGCGTVVEDQYIFLPERQLVAQPSDFGLAYEEAIFAASDGVRLHGWFIPAAKARHTLVWFHGNAGNVSHRLANAQLFHQALGVHIFLFDYRGYGRSEGGPSEAGLYMDGEAALSYLRNREDLQATRVVLFGRSLGAAVVVELAQREPVAGVILESPFTSVPEMARQLLPFLPWQRLLKTRFDSLSKIGSLRPPLLVLHGDRDEVVPFAMGRRLFEAARGPKRFHPIPGASHNDTYLVGGQAYLKVLRDFLDSLEKGPEGSGSGFVPLRG
ncbi:MAG: alpha/beta hydrolase [Candidatus Methylomirabilales bacterium]